MQTTLKLKLPGVTLCAADCVTPALAARALRVSRRACDFGDAILFTHEPVADEQFRSVKIPALDSRDAYSRFIFNELKKHIATPHALIVQWDGYVLEPHAWDPRFLDYDYIGANWDWHTDGMRVGNGGFSLRSRRLLDLLGNDRFPFLAGANEDEQICRLYRPQLVSQYGIQFAPEALAAAFSYERTRPSAPTFGFHGLFNLWRHVHDEELLSMAADFSTGIIVSREYLELLLLFASAGKFAPLQRLYRRLRELRSLDQIRADVGKLTASAQHTEFVIGLGEKVAAMPPLRC